MAYVFRVTSLVVVVNVMKVMGSVGVINNVKKTDFLVIVNVVNDAKMTS